MFSHDLHRLEDQHFRILSNLAVLLRSRRAWDTVAFHKAKHPGKLSGNFLDFVKCRQPFLRIRLSSLHVSGLGFASRWIQVTSESFVCHGYTLAHDLNLSQEARRNYFAKLQGRRDLGALAAHQPSQHRRGALPGATLDVWDA